MPSGECNERQCIYCLQYKDTAEFDREHVLNYAFGTFEPDTPTINCVCRECNNSLGCSIDQELARGTFEGMQRYSYKVCKASKESVREMARRVPELTYPEAGPLQGVILTLGLSEAGEVVVAPVAQVGFRKKKDGNWVSFRFDPSQTVEEMSLADYDKVRLFAPTKDQEAEINMWLEREHVHGLNTEFVSPPGQTGDRRIWIEVIWNMTSNIGRSIAKIALNYAAYKEGEDFVLHPSLDSIRRFIRYGDGDPSDFVCVSTTPPFSPSEYNVGHSIGLKLKRSLELLGVVSLFNALTYTVRLTPCFDGIYRRIAHGLYYDIRNRKILPIHATQLYIPGQRMPWK